MRAGVEEWDRHPACLRWATLAGKEFRDRLEACPTLVDELDTAQKQSAHQRADHAAGDSDRLFGGAVSSRTRTAAAPLVSGVSGDGSGAAAVPGHRVLAASARPDRRLARLAAIGHLFARRHGLDSVADAVADFVAVDSGRVAAAGAGSTGRRTVHERLAPDALAAPPARAQCARAIRRRDVRARPEQFCCARDSAGEGVPG